ncbi:uncharacterized protein LOC128266453 isoform X2 [Drosophila gunungcola]|uniref:uncharacterized protein LOC128266453 isoform X2 n=1 Tax=Drosophila gunungcola TaxID=103775 RepID=UPI0022E70F42|nr:uncharacterized protein LOC128266453 isoform X2 [Drosophila gunungcola]
MDSNIDNPASDVGVLAPNELENEDANRNSQVPVAAGTPVARKTRRAVPRRMNTTSENESPFHSDAPKTPGIPGNLGPAPETPRRSCRKSVRPTIDYDDIIVGSARKIIAEPPLAEAEDEMPSTQKWTAAEVGRNSRKRSRKSKRVTTKKQKTEQDVPKVSIEEDQELPEVDMNEEQQKENQVLEEKIKDNQKTELETPRDQVESPQAQDKTLNVKTDDIKEVEMEKPQLKRKSSRASKKKAQPKEKNPSKFKPVIAEADIDELGLCPLDTDGQEEGDIRALQCIYKVIQNENSRNDDQKVAENAEIFQEPAVQDRDLEMAVSANDYITQSAQEAEEVDEQTIPEEEMPSLLVENDDLDEPEKSPLNTTFDADKKNNLDASVILVVNPDMQPLDIDASVILVESPDKQPSVSVPILEITEQKPAIKVVLTTENDQNRTLLDLASPKPKISKGFRFPTPYKTKPLLKFTDSSTKFDQTFRGLDKVEDQKYERKRSKSSSDWNETMSRTVTFQSPVEIANLEEIDERWKGLQKNNVNQRSRRSKSLDESRCKMSRIPKPSRGIIPVTRTITPSKVNNKRTKMPNFAAMHEKQFAKMESLLEHVERKAERAKVLTNSVLKQLPGSTAKKQQQNLASVEDRPRPKAQKKIDMTANRAVIMEVPAEKLNSSRLPLKTTAPALNAAPKPAFNLSTSTLKTFNATFTNYPAESHDNKLAERRQRRIEMFKGRNTTKAQNKKGEFIRGVRLNRRFELQMQHRRHLEE